MEMAFVGSSLMTRSSTPENIGRLLQTPSSMAWLTFSALFSLGKEVSLPPPPPRSSVKVVVVRKTKRVLPSKLAVTPIREEALWSR